MISGAETMAGTPLAAAMALFVPGVTVARFVVGPAGLPTVLSRVDAIPAAELRSADFIPSTFQTIDASRGVIQFGPDRAMPRGIHSQPVAALERALGVRRLPEPLTALGRLSQQGTDAAPDIVALFAAFEAMGYTVAQRPDDQQPAPGRGQPFVTWTSVRITNEWVEFALTTHMMFDPRPPVVVDAAGKRTPAYYLRADYGATSTTTPWRMTLSLVREQDRMTIEGYERLSAGAQFFLGNLVEGVGPVRVEVREGLFSLGVLPSFRAPQRLDSLRMDVAGKYLGDVPG